MNVVGIRDNAPLIRDIPGQLRQLANDIEQGKYPGVLSCACVLDGPDMAIFGWGDIVQAGPEVHLLLAAAQQKMVQAVISAKHGWD